VPSVAEIQAAMREALLTGRTSALAGCLRGGVDPEKRLAIHQRHYRASLITSLLDRFPATVWLVGSEFVGTAADAFVSHVPPSRPCIAEYGEDFPAFLADRPGADTLPYLGQFAALEWHLARVSLAVDLPPVTPSDLHAVGPHELTDARFDLQPGLHYIRLDWALDELVGLYLTDRSPESFALTPGPVFLEVHGSRGELHMTRLGPAAYAFRSTLATGGMLAAAVAAAATIDTAFDPGQALVEMLGRNLITMVRPPDPYAPIEVAP
jgi:hypothetical protein